MIRTYLSAVLLVVVPAALAGLLTSTAVAATNPCTGSGLNGGVLICSGTCPEPGTCQPVARPVGDETAIFCGCQVGQMGWACCYLLKWTSGPHKDEFFVLGDCISCSQPGNCTLTGSGTQVDPYNAECVVQP